MKNGLENSFFKGNKTIKSSHIINKIRGTFLKILYSKMGDENQFWLTPMGWRIIGKVGYVDKDFRFVIPPKYATVSKFSDEWLVRCGLPDPKWILPGVFMDEVRNHVWELLEIVEDKGQWVSFLKVNSNYKWDENNLKKYWITRKATVFGLIPNRILWLHGGWIKSENIPFLKPKIEDISISEEKENIKRKELQKTIYNILKGNRSVKRAAPSHPEVLEKIISDSIKNNLPIPIFQYWWMGARHVPWKYEDACFQNLQKTFEEISGIYEPWTSLSLIFCDTHMEINGFSEDHRISYLQVLIPMATSYGWQVTCMSEFTTLSLKDFHTKVREKVKDFPIPEWLQEKLLISASRRPIRDDFQAAAEEYWTVNVLEREIIEQFFSNQIFLTFNDSKDDILFSDTLGILHWYPIKKGRTDKPWFLEEL